MNTQTIQQISKELKIPLSSVWKKIQELKICSLILEKSSFTKQGRKIMFYQSRIKDIKISIRKFEPLILFNENNFVKEF